MRLALRSYGRRVETYARQLDIKIRDSTQPIDATTLFQFYAFDVMGSFAYGKDFDLMRTGQLSFAIKMLGDGMAAVGLLAPVPWLFRIFINLPIISQRWNRMLSWAVAQLQQRIKVWSTLLPTFVCAKGLRPRQVNQM